VKGLNESLSGAGRWDGGTGEVFLLQLGGTDGQSFEVEKFGDLSGNKIALPFL